MLADSCSSHFYSNNVSTELRETLEEGTSNDTRALLGNRASTYNVQNGTEAASDSWISNCHQQITAFIDHCGQGVRRCTEPVFACNSPTSINYICSPAATVGAAAGTVIGGALGVTLCLTHGLEDRNVLTGAIMAGGLVGAGFGYFLVGPFLYQIRVGSWDGLCAREN